MMKISRIVLSIAAVGLSAQVAAQDADMVRGVECGTEREVQAGALPEPTYNRLSDIYEAIGEEKYAEAYEDLAKLLERNQRDDFVRATILQAMAHIRAQQERYRESIELFQRSIDLDRLPNSQHYQMILQVAQLLYTIEEYQQALDQLDYWFCVTPDEQEDKVQVWVMKASIHAEIEEFRKALNAIDRAIAMSDEPKESWYQLKLGMLFELEEFEPAIDVLNILIAMKPEKKSYWIQLSSVYQQLERQREAMATLALAHKKGLLDKQTEYLQLASLRQEYDAPRLAAEVLEEGLEAGIIEPTKQNWEMTAGAWYQAREMEKALAAYERAGAQSTDGNLDLQRAFILTGQERWERAIGALRRALDKGGLSETENGNAYLLLGTALFNTGDLDGAMDAFDQAENYGKVRQAAREWMNHVRQERSRQAGRSPSE
jgi:tetratricopeptide (TPR) repeat protein